jgi:hypothetical protein
VSAQCPVDTFGQFSSFSHRLKSSSRYRLSKDSHTAFFSLLSSIAICRLRHLLVVRMIMPSGPWIGAPDADACRFDRQNWESSTRFESLIVSASISSLFLKRDRRAVRARTGHVGWDGPNFPEVSEEETPNLENIRCKTPKQSRQSCV